MPPTRSYGFIVAHAITALCFAFSVAVQYNDPDPVRWMAIYGAALVASLIDIRSAKSLRLAVPTGIVAIIWAATIAPRVVGKVAFASLFESFEMKNEQIEEAREFGGLLIVAFWMAVIALRRWPRRSAG